MKRFLVYICTITLALVLAKPAFAMKRDSLFVRVPVKTGATIEKDTTGHHTRLLVNHLIAPKSELQIGATALYGSVSSEDSDFYLVLDDMDFSGTFFRITPFVGYTYKDNRSVGLRFGYTGGKGSLDAATLDLLNDGLSFGGELGMNIKYWGFKAEAYHRSYVGLDNNGRVGIFYDLVLGYGLTKAIVGSALSDYSLKNQARLSFNPGIVVYPLNNVSVFVSISLADLTYNNVRIYENAARIGTRNNWDARLKFNLTDIDFGITLHL